MKRRDFVRVAAGGLSAAALSSGPWACGERPSLGDELGEAGEAPFQRWCWVHGGGERTPAQWHDQYARLAEAGFHGVLVGGGDTEAHSQGAHAAGLEFHRWIWTLNRNGDVWVKENHPEWFTVSRNRKSSLDHSPYVGYYKWLCPTRPAVREYLKESILEVARDAAVDGIHLDYIRHCDVILPQGLWSVYDLIQDREYAEFDFCYCDTCRESFAATHGRDPLELPDPSMDESWRRFRWDSVTGLVEVLAEAVHGVNLEPHPSGSNTAGELSAAGSQRPDDNRGQSRSILRPKGPGKPISAAVFPSPTIARRLVRQAWDEWPVDTVFPMLYHSFYEADLEWIGAGIREGLAAMSQRKDGGGVTPQQIFAGLYLPALSEEERASATEIARQAGARGVSFFEMGGLGI